MATVWLGLLVFVLATYVVLDGFDLGVGVLHLFVAKSREEREQVLRSIAPVWDGNEVWLIAAGGTMFLAFPSLLGTAFSGFYLPLMIVLWLLVFRALGIELRHQFHDPMWEGAWDVAFAVASILLAICLGAALGNVVRGVPLGEDGTFFEPLWTDFRVGQETGILDWYTVLIGLTALAALAHHGALWLMARTDGAVRERSSRVGDALLGATLATVVLATVFTFRVQPAVSDNLAERPWGIVFPVVAAVGLAASAVLRRRNRFRAAFASSAAFLYGMIASAAIGIYPYVLPARQPEFGLTVFDAAAPAYGLRVALLWWIPGMAIAIGYFVLLYTRLAPGRHRRQKESLAER